MSGKSSSQQQKLAFDVLDNSIALILITEWPEFRSIDFNIIKNKLKSAIIFDGRNQYRKRDMKKNGIEYLCIG